MITNVINILFSHEMVCSFWSLYDKLNISIQDYWNIDNLWVIPIQVNQLLLVDILLRWVFHACLGSCICWTHEIQNDIFQPCYGGLLYIFIESA